ncbi:MAG: magnesium/cobalt transporter CorA [Rhodocyclaceae bacterium]|nr:magnesium/cobalt transporter CorA [Rhodocyclaceae bacterium]
MLINCVAYQDGRKLTAMTTEAISDYVERPDCFVWVALRDATDAELDTMQEEFHLHPLAVEDARHGHQRPKIEEYGDSLFAVLQIVERQDGQLALGELDVFVGVNYVLSVRNRSQQGFLGVRARCEAEPHLLKLGSGFVLYALMDAVVDGYFPLIDELESTLEAIEEHIFDKNAAQANIERLYDLKRQTTVLKHAVTPLMDAAARLHGARVPRMCAGSQDYFRDVHDHLIRISASIETLRDTVSTAILVSQSTIGIEQNEINKRLAAWAGIFAVVTAFAGIWGMNFKAMPELDWTYGYPAALAVMTVVCVVLYVRFKRAGWL